MSNFYRAVKALEEADEFHGAMVDNEAYVRALQAAGLLMSDMQVIRTPEELEALAREDADAVVLAGETGVVRTVEALCGMNQLVHMWGLPAVVIATGDQVREAREAMEKENG